MLDVLFPAMLALAALQASPVAVRVEKGAGGPRILVDGTAVPPRMFFGLEGAGRIEVTADWSSRSFEIRPPIDAPGNGTFHFRFGQLPGEVSLADVRVTDLEGRDILPPGSFGSPKGFAEIWSVFPPDERNTVGKAEVADGVLRVTLRKPDRGDWPDFHLHSRLLLRFKAGERYRVSFRVRASPARAITPALYSVANDAWRPIGGPPGPFLEQVAYARDAGVRFISFSAPECWMPPDLPEDWEMLDLLCRSIIEAHPRALLLPRVGSDAPSWWLDRHPEARMAYEGGRRGNHASVSDREYRADAAAHLEKLCRHLTEAFPEHFAGIHPCGQNTGEWFYEATWETPLSGYDPATLRAFREWLAARGAPDAESARTPTPDERHAAPSGLLRDPAKERRLIDFERFRQIEMADMVTALAAAARRGTGGKKLVVFFYGYHYEFGAVATGAASSGHYALERVLRSPDIDILCSPISYGDRGFLGTAPSMSSAESVMLAGKLWLNEDDTRTYLSHTTEYGGLADLAQTRSVMRRNTAQAAIRGFGTWWMDLPAAGWFADPRIWEEMKLLGPIDEALLRRERAFAPEIAAIVDEDSMCHLAGGAHVAGLPLIYEGRQVLGRVGAPYGQYMLADAIAGRVPAKLQVFLAAWALTPEERRGLASSRSRDVVRVWVWAPGYILPDRADVAAMEEVTGFRHRVATAPSAVVTPTAAGARLGLSQPWGVGAPVRPLFAAEASPEESLATYPDGSTAVALRRGERGTDIFVGTPRLTPEFLRVAARLAKVHLFTEIDSSVWAAEGILSIQALRDGPLEVNLGGRRSVLDIKAGETRILRY